MKEETFLREREKLEPLVEHRLWIIQHQDRYRFSLEAVILSHFLFLKGGEKVIDLGTGSGVIPLLLVSREPTITVTGLEIQEEMADMARRSVGVNGLQQNIQVVTGDLRDAAKVLGTGSFDIVVTNPPYLNVSRGKISPKDSIAQARHEITCTLSDILKSTSSLLKYKGLLAMVHRPERLAEIIIGMEKNRLQATRLRFVHPFPDRPANMVLIEAEKLSRRKTEIMPPLVVFAEQGHYTEEMANYLGFL
ncbi:MAG: tRNA1(Val) (adenine(37)-N6)-methyltransferase [Bacillota bacterium]